MKNLNLIVNQNEISQDGNEYLTSGGYKSIQCNFSFSEEWNNLTKTAIFLYNGVAYNETLIDDKCFIPHEAIENKGELSIGVFGTEILGENLEKRNTTDLLNVKIYEGSFIKGIQPEKPSPETWELYLEEVNKLIEEATNKIDSFTAEDIKFEDGETFQEKYDNGEFAGGGSTINESKFMKKEIYDIDDDGIVDNSSKVNNHTVESDVPANAIFTDTTYDIATRTNDGLMSASDKQKLDGQVAELDEYGKVLSSQLPSYVDDVVEATLETFPENGESGKIYVDIETNLSYRWTGTAYTVISPSIALGETSSTAYRGDRGKTAYEHSQESHAPVDAQENIIENIKLDGIDLQVENKEINLNLEDNLVCVNSTEPTDNRKKVWLQKGKNLFNKNNYNVFNGYIDDSTLLWNNNANGNFIYLKVEPNTTYTISREIVAEQFAIATGVNVPTAGEYATSFIDGTGKTSVSITTGENDNYLYVYVLWKTNTSPILSEILNSLQVELGRTATDYEENVTSTIYTKNNNNEYEKFSETVAISLHQPINQNRLWLQKGKNLLNPTISYLGDYTYNNGVYTLTSGSHIYLMCENLIVGKPYTVSYKNLNGFNQVRVNDYNYGNIFIEYGRNTETSGTITFIATTSTAIVAFLSGSAGSTIEDVQLELGSTTTNYEEYVDKKIYTKNNNVYEEFINADEVKNDYSLGERRIGTWIDGKPIYRKGFIGTLSSGTNMTLTTSGKYYHIINSKGNIYTSTGNIEFGKTENSDTSNSYSRVYIYNGNVGIDYASGFAGRAFEISLEYTKTTDVATTSEE